MKKKTAPVTPNTYTSPLQTQASQVSDTERGTANQNLGAASTGFSNFVPGASGSSQYRKNLYSGLSTAANRAGENALAHSRERAQMAGFGSASQPLTAGAESQLANENANRMAQIPLAVDREATPFEMQASQGLAGIGSTQLGDARGMFGQASGMEDQRLAEFYKQQEEERKRKAGIWGSLAKIGLNVGGAFAGLPPGTLTSGL